MALFSRAATAAEAVYARSLDGQHLWLAVRGEGPLVLRGEGHEIELPHEVDGGLIVTVFPLVAALAHDSSDVVELHLRAGRRAIPVTSPPSTPSGPALATPAAGGWQLEVTDLDGAVVVRRTRRADCVEAVAFRVSDDAVEVDLDSGDTLTLAEQVELAPGQTVVVEADGRPVVRRRNVLTRPNFATAMPPMPEPDVELRWLKDGRLAVHRRGGDA